MLCYISTNTKNIKIGPYCTNAIKRHPSAIASSTLTLDRITGGRINLGIKALEQSEVTAFGIDIKKIEKDLFKEQVEVIKLLLESFDKRSNCKGEYYNLYNAYIQSPSIRKPHPPIYITSHDSTTLQLYATHGDGWIPIGYAPELYKHHV